MVFLLSPEESGWSGQIVPRLLGISRAIPNPSMPRHEQGNVPEVILTSPNNWLPFN